MCDKYGFLSVQNGSILYGRFTCERKKQTSRRTCWSHGWNNMINRNYLPYKSAIEYTDRGMAKWMGFFISEHTTAINTQGDTIDFSNNMDEDEKRLLLNPLYFFKGLSYLYTSTQREPYLGKVVDCTNDIIYFSTK